ncbi:MAG: FAD-binding oxidoreductase [Chloroflexi bacterium]|nr:FAD-binding oxidoreductase [Chloroflexota bacterium]
MNRTEVVVIGAGSVGANVAYRLAQRGARVTVLDAGAPGQGTSSTSFAWTNAFGKTPRDYHDLNTASMREHLAMVDELGGNGARWHHQNGGIHWRQTAETQAALRVVAERARSWNYPVQTVSPADARELEPDLAIPNDIGQVFFTPSEGYVEVLPFIAALLTGARRNGATVVTHTQVKGVVREGERIVGIVTSDGERYMADVVVNCAGPAMDEVARLAGVEIPFNRVPGRLIYTTPVATTLKRPVYAPAGHFRPDGAGRIVLAHGDHDETVDARDDAWTAEESLAAIARHLPVLKGARVEAVRIGVRPMPCDEKPMIGYVPGTDGYYVVVSHSGVTLGPLWGRVAANEILDDRPDARLEPYRVARFV